MDQRKKKKKKIVGFVSLNMTTSQNKIVVTAVKVRFLMNAFMSFYCHFDRQFHKWIACAHTFYLVATFYIN